MKRVWCMLVCLLAALLLSVAAAAEDGTAAMTLMVYLCGSDLETTRGAASADLAEMIAAYPDGDNLQVVVMASGAAAWHSDIAPDTAAIYALDGEGLQLVSRGVSGSMGDPATLGALLACGYEQFPARRYALLLWDHGAGPMLGVCFDERYTDDDGMDGLTLGEIGQALAASPFAREKLEWIGFDACLMASLETACMAAPYARYMIASQEAEPSSGWNYAFLTGLAQDVSGADTGRRAAECYMASLGDSLVAATLSCVDLSRVAEVSAGMDALFGGLRLTQQDGGYTQLAACRADTKSTGCSAAYAYDLIDLIDLLEVYQAEGVADCGSLLEQLGQAVVVNRSNTPFLNGLSVYYPFENKAQYRTAPPAPDMLPSEYAAFLAETAEIWLGDSLTDWSGARSLTAEATAGETTVTLPLTREQAAGFTSARLLILAQVRGDEYQLIYQTDDAALTADGLVTSAYRGDALFLTDSRGETLTGAIPYRLTEDGLALSVILIGDNEAGDSDICGARLMYRLEEGGTLTFIGALAVTEDPTLQGKATVNLGDYDRMGVYGGTAVPQQAEDGALLPWSQWTKGETVYGYWLDLAQDDWQPAFLKAQDGLQRYAMLEVTDVQYHTVCSELMAIDNPNILPLAVEEQLLLDAADCRLTLTGAQLIRGLYPSLRVLMTCENRTERTMTLEPAMLRLDDTVVMLMGGSTQTIAPGEAQTVQVEFSGERLQISRVQAFSRCMMTLTAKADYTETMFTADIAFDLTGDASAVIDLPEKEEPIAVGLWDGVAIELTGLREEDGQLRGTARLCNTTGVDIVLDCDTGYLNGLELPATLTGQLTPMTLPAGCEVYTDLCIYARQEAWPFDRTLLHGAPLAEMGVTQLTEVGFRLHHGDRSGAENVLLPLNGHLAWPAGETPCAADSWPVLYDDGHVTVRLMDVRTHPGHPYTGDRRMMYLCIGNTSDQAASVQVTALDVDGRREWTLLQPETVPAGATLYTQITAVRPDDQAEPEAFGSMTASLTVTACGEEHALRVTVEALEPPVTVGSESVYEPGQLRVRLEPGG